MHRYNRKDVEAAFERYQQVTGDKSASLHYSVTGGKFWNVLGCRMKQSVWPSHREAYKALHGYADGFQDALRFGKDG